MCNKEEDSEAEMLCGGSHYGECDKGKYLKAESKGAVGLRCYLTILPSSNGKDGQIRNFHW